MSIGLIPCLAYRRRLKSPHILHVQNECASVNALTCVAVWNGCLVTAPGLRLITCCCCLSPDGSLKLESRCRIAEGRNGMPDSLSLLLSPASMFSALFYLFQPITIDDFLCVPLLFKLISVGDLILMHPPSSLCKPLFCHTASSVKHS